MDAKVKPQIKGLGGPVIGGQSTRSGLGGIGIGLDKILNTQKSKSETNTGIRKGLGVEPLDTVLTPKKKKKSAPLIALDPYLLGE